ncbi:MAG: FixH family protein, partial [Chloroflexota bacterium]
TVHIYNERRQEVDRGQPQAAPGDPLSVVEELRPSLPRGTYAVSWHTTSAEDGHVTGGAFAFGIGVQPASSALLAQSLPAAPTQGPLSVSIRWLSYLAVGGLLGLLLFRLAVFDPVVVELGLASAAMDKLTGQIRSRRRAAIRLFAALGAIAAVATILDQVARSGGEITVAAMTATLGTGLGQLLAARLATAVALLALLWSGREAARPRFRSLGAAAAAEFGATGRRVPPLPWQLPAAVAVTLAELLLFSLTSHAMAVPTARDMALFVDWLHLCLAGFWVGGLLALALTVVPPLAGPRRATGSGQPNELDRNRLFGPLIGQFSRLALGAVMGLAATGLYQAYLHFSGLDQVLSTGYGQALVVKTGIFAAALLLAGWHRFILEPGTRQPASPRATRSRGLFGRGLAAEALLGVAVLAAAGVLTSLAPANTEASASGFMTRTVGNVQVALQVQPLRIGPNQFEVTLQSNGQPLAKAEKVEMTFTMLDMQMEQTVVDLSAAGNGNYTAQSDALSMGGHWRVDVLLRLPRQYDQHTSFNVDVKG